MNQVIYWGRPLDWRNQTLTPNPDAIYFMAFFNTKDAGPIVIEVPPGDADGSLNGNIVTVWQTSLEDVGLLGLDKGAGGKFLVLPPGYKERVPEGYIALPSDTYGGYALLRSNLKSHGDADVAAAIAYGKRVKVYPLSRRPIRPRRCSPTPRTSSSTARSATTPASSSSSTASCRASLDRARPGDDRSAPHDRDREGQALRAGRDDAGDP